MTDAIPLSEVPEDLGRNDPCPCGSGKKYKKCCQRVHRLQKEAQKTSRGVEDLVDDSTNAWNVFKTLRQINENNMYSLFFDFSHEEGPFRERYDNTPSYNTAAYSGDAPLVAPDGADLRRFRLDEPNTHLLITEGLDDPRADSYRYTIVTLRPNEVGADGDARKVEHPGPRVWDVARFERPKSDLDDGDLSFDDLGLEWGTDTTQS
ncbi:MAG: SEC-C domain-containing protein [Myxococcota bacterium]